jgi:hypothetical protein
MDAVKILQEIKESGLDQSDPARFWYVYAIIVTVLLVLLITGVILLVKGFLTSFLADIKDTNQKFAASIEKLTVSNANLTKMMELHDYQIGHLEQDIKEFVKRRRP